MKTQLDNLIKLSKEIIDYLRENGILQFNHVEYTKNINCYRAYDNNATQVKFGQYRMDIAIPHYVDQVTIATYHTAETLEQLYSTVLAEFEDFKLNKAQEMKAEYEAQKAERIETLKKELDELSK